MALRDQPYLPLYVQDFLTDEKLSECSAQSTGVYIRIMCIMHKSEQYGNILLKQKHKQTDKQILNFALLLAKHFPYSVDVIESSLTELIEEGVLIMQGDLLIQKRMVKDNELSIKRAESGKKGGIKSLGKEQDFAQAKFQANTENEIDIENDIDIKNKGASKFKIPTISEISEYCKERQNKVDADRFFNFYESKGWLVGKTKMKDWRAAVRNWEKSEQTQNNNGNRHKQVLCIPGRGQGSSTL